MTTETTHPSVLVCADLVDAVIAIKTATVQIARDIVRGGNSSVGSERTASWLRMSDAALDWADAYVMTQAASAAVLLDVAQAAFDT